MPNLEASQNGPVRHNESNASLFEIGESDLSRLLERPRPVNIERKRSFDERSFSDMSGISSPRSFPCVEAHPIVAEAWAALGRSVVNFRGQPVGTIAALDHSNEELNYDQVKKFVIVLIWFLSALVMGLFCRRSLFETLCRVLWRS